ncbi:MAG: glycosyltransferase family 4 protein [Acidobacteriota bacterium]
MKKPFSLVLGTNVWTHLQVPLAEAFTDILGAEHFRMAVFHGLDEERRTLGWEERRSLPWVAGPPSDEREREALWKLCMDADVMVFGACPDELLKARALAGKLTLVQAERMLKKPYHALRMMNPRYARGIRRFRGMVNHPNVHALTIGYHAPEDLHQMGAYGSRVWRWGYFVDVNPEKPAPAGDRPVRIMWAGRMIDWKKVDVLLRAVSRIQHEPWFGSLNVIGDGAERAKLEALARRLSLDEGKVTIEHAIPFAEIRTRMRASDLYVLPSNRHEGWGAVTGEAMSEGCVVVANETAGSARELVTDRETGYLFRDGDAAHLASVIAHAARAYEERMEIRQRAWERMHALWHPRVAAERLVELALGLLGHAPMPIYESGPCCHAASSGHQSSSSKGPHLLTGKGRMQDTRDGFRRTPIFQLSAK